MKLGIMQPYFFPYLGYFDLINSVNKWVIFDTAQYIRHGWVNRNRILHPKSGWQYIIVPLKKHSKNTQISEITISDQNDWRSRIIRQLDHYKKQAIFFDETINFVVDSLSDHNTYLSRLSVSILDRVCARLDIQFDYTYFSEMDLKLAPIEDPGDWAFQIAKTIGATEYINPSGGAHLFDRKKFKRAGIKLTIQKFENLEYKCRRYEFIPALSIIDAFMWNSLDKIKDHLNRSNL